VRVRRPAVRTGRPVLVPVEHGATTRCINVGPGTYSLVITNTETGCVSNNTCSKTINPRTPPCVGVTVDAPASVRRRGVRAVRHGDELRHDGGRPRGRLQRREAELRGRSGGRDGSVVHPAVMTNCTGGSATFNVTAKATNDCGPITQRAATRSSARCRRSTWRRSPARPRSRTWARSTTRSRSAIRRPPSRSRMSSSWTTSARTRSGRAWRIRPRPALLASVRRAASSPGTSATSLRWPKSSSPSR